jgi:dTDP-4-amino-4,6-dideoxy-D-galactose acyltransferase
MDPGERVGATLIEPLQWDSAHYGKPVGRLTARRLATAELARALEEAEGMGLWLLYWLTEASAVVEPSLLERFHGLKVSGQVRYTRTLTAKDDVAAAAHPQFEVGLDESMTAGPELVRLGIAAGALSRFRTDPRLPPEKCDELYAIWIAKSVSKQMADEVLVARQEGVPVGLVTLRLRKNGAEIGLVSTDALQRGRGVATALLRFAHTRLRARGIERLEVVTQAENVAACQLYERAGYTIAESGDYYHVVFTA